MGDRTSTDCIDSGVAARTHSIALSVASGVAGTDRGTSEASPKAATAARIASRTAKASINGGSPTALLPKITPSWSARSNR